MKKEIIDYIKEYTNSIESKRIIKKSSALNNLGFNLWSFKKLIFLEYYIKPYLTILSEKHKSNCYYLDLFGSAGANHIEELNLNSLGSPIISILKGVVPNKSKGINTRFHKWIFFKKNNDFYKALIQRVEETIQIVNETTGENLEIGKDIEILNGDANILIEEIIQKIEKESKKERVSILVFIDPYKFSEIEWNTIKKILEIKYVDVIFTIPTWTLKRGLELCKKKEIYLGPTLLKECSKKNFSNISEEKIGELYAKDIVQIVLRDIYYLGDNSVSVKNNFNLELYKIELFSHSKLAVEIAESLAKRLKKLNCNNLKELINQILGKQTSLQKFY